MSASISTIQPIPLDCKREEALTRIVHSLEQVATLSNTICASVERRATRIGERLRDIRARAEKTDAAIQVSFTLDGYALTVHIVSAPFNHRQGDSDLRTFEVSLRQCSREDSLHKDVPSWRDRRSVKKLREHHA